METMSTDDIKLLDEVEASCRQLESKSYTASLMQEILVFTDEFVRAADSDVYSDDARMFNTLEDEQHRNKLKEFLDFEETPLDPETVLKCYKEMFHTSCGEYIYIYISIYLYIYISIYLIYLSIYLSIHISI